MPPDVGSAPVSREPRARARLARCRLDHRSPYAVRAVAWFAPALTVRDARGAVLGCIVPAEGEAAEVALDLDAGSVVTVHLDRLDGSSGAHRVSVRELVVMEAPVAPRPSPPPLAVEASAALEPGESTLALLPIAPGELQCGALAVDHATELSLSVEVASALDVSARGAGPVGLAVLRAEFDEVVGCDQGERPRIARRLPSGRYRVVVAAPSDAPVTLDASVVALPRRAGAAPSDDER